MAEESRFTIVYSRYGRHEASTRVSALKPLRLFGHSGNFEFLLNDVLCMNESVVNMEFKQRLELELEELDTSMKKFNIRVQEIEKELEVFQEVERKLRQKKVIFFSYVIYIGLIMRIILRKLFFLKNNNV
jgi:hypothetical protein